MVSIHVFLVEKPTEYWLRNMGTIILGKVQKKYKHAKKVLATSQDVDGPAKREKISYPTGQTHGRGNFNLSTFLSQHSGISKEDYNTFIVRNFPLLEFTC